MKQSAVKTFALSLGLTLAASAQAKIYLDAVTDPLPLVEIHTIIPRGANNSDLKNLAAAEIVDVILESGTKYRTKQQFNDALAAFGANVALNVGSEFTSLAVSFPYLENKNYAELFKIVREAFYEPRFDNATFEVARTKQRAGATSLLDNDSALLNSFIRDWEYFKALKKKPMTIEDIDSLQLKEVQAFYHDKILASEDVWVGLVTPAQGKEVFTKEIAQLFDKQGSVSEGEHLEPMIKTRKTKLEITPSKTFVILDKKDRTQNIVSVNVLVGPELSDSKELNFRFGNYLTVGSGMGSTFVDTIRTKNGFAYYVSRLESKLMGNPSFGFSTNPVSARIIDAFKTIGDLVGGYYERSEEGFSKYPSDVIASKLTSYRYAEIMSRASEVKKLMRRKLVIFGEITPGYYKSNPKDWKVDQKDVVDTFKGLYDKSMVVAGAVGDASALESLVKLNFPDYQVMKIPFKDAITAKPYK